MCPQPHHALFPISLFNWVIFQSAVIHPAPMTPSDLSHGHGDTNH